jgi:hypothetical protein
LLNSGGGDHRDGEDQQRSESGALSVSTLVVAVAGIASFLAFPLGMARSSPAWSLPVSFFCWSVALLLPGLVVARLGRLRPPEVVAQLSLTALAWNGAVWLPIPALRVIALVAVPLAILLVAAVVGRRDGPGEEISRPTRLRPAVFRAFAWNSLSSLGLFLGIAHFLNLYGFVRAR